MFHSTIGSEVKGKQLACVASDLIENESSSKSLIVEQNEKAGPGTNFSDSGIVFCMLKFTNRCMTCNLMNRIHGLLHSVYVCLSTAFIFSVFSFSLFQSLVLRVWIKDLWGLSRPSQGVHEIKTIIALILSCQYLLSK